MKVPISISPKYVNFKGLAGQTITKTVFIRAGLDKPLELEPEFFDLGTKVAYRIEEVNKGKVYRIRFTTIASREEIFHGVLRLKTNYPEKPEISISVRGKFKRQKSSVSEKKEQNSGITLE